jgi:molecular chaperone HscB
MNYFELYELPVSFELDEGALKRKFYELSKRYHPDFYINETPEKQAEVLELATLTNKAYQTLSHLQKRIEYILELKGLLSEDGQYQLPQEFLMEMMEVNEALMDLEFEIDPALLNQITEKIAAMEQDLLAELQDATRKFDTANTDAQQEIVQKIIDIWYRQKYLLRIRESLNRFASR